LADHSPVVVGDLRAARALAKRASATILHRQLLLLPLMQFWAHLSLAPRLMLHAEVRSS
jgi:hypothetical protein